MLSIVTIGPTQEPLDAMRIITNRSTGKLGTLLAASLAAQGHDVIAFRGTGATASPSPLSHGRIRVIPFTTTEDLRNSLQKFSGETRIDAVYHAAAVSDFYLPGAGNGKIPTNKGTLTLTLEPTPKILQSMRSWFPGARVTGWKFEATGSREDALAAGRAQISACATDSCVVNGPSYGKGFGVLSAKGAAVHFADRAALCAHLAES